MLIVGIYGEKLSVKFAGDAYLVCSEGNPETPLKFSSLSDAINCAAMVSKFQFQTRLEQVFSYHCGNKHNSY